MKITKRQLRQIIREGKHRLIQEGSSYEEIKRIRDSGDYSWRDMEWEVVDLMESMQTFPAQDVIDIMYSALDSEDREDSGFWHMMLSDGGHLYEALDGLKATADEEYDPDVPMQEALAQSAHPRYGLGKNIADAEFPIAVGYEGRSEVVYDQEALDELLDYLTVDNNIAYSLESLRELEPDSDPAGAGIENYGEGLVLEKVNPALAEIERELRYTMAEYIDTYMMSMSMNPGDAADRRRVSQKVGDIVATIIGD